MKVTFAECINLAIEEIAKEEKETLEEFEGPLREIGMSPNIIKGLSANLAAQFPDEDITGILGMMFEIGWRARIHWSK